MKKMLMLVTLGALLMLALAVPPVFAASKTEKVAYTASGYIYGPTNWGEMSLTISGNIHQRAPDYDGEGEGTFYEAYELSYTEEFGTPYLRDGAVWRTLTVTRTLEVRQGSVVIHYEGWYSPQSKFNGKIDSAWQDGSATTFTVQLEPNRIEKETRVGTMTIEVVETTTYEHFRREYVTSPDGPSGWMWGWQYTEDGPSVTLDFWASTFEETSLFFDFSGKIQSKGRSPIQGTFMLWANLRTLDGVSEETSISGWGQFGPYYLSAY